MSDFWSKQVQSSEMLYYSRAEKFNDENRNFWFKRLKIKDGMKVLEVGCGGGLYTNMIKKYYPNCEVYGIDIDENHIKFAKSKSKELKLNVKYSVADIKSLPFKDEYFDLVFSHTVVEHVEFNDFINEQKRVLKKNRNLVIMRVDMVKKNDKPFMYLEDEINELYGKMKFTSSPSVAKFLVDPNVTMQQLSAYNFKNIDFKYDRVIYYMPDIAKSKKIALKQIERNYFTKLTFALFSLNRAKNGNELKDELLSLLERQYKKRVEILNSNEKLYDFQSSLMITISAKK